MKRSQRGCMNSKAGSGIGGLICKSGGAVLCSVACLYLKITDKSMSPSPGFDFLW